MIMKVTKRQLKRIIREEIKRIGGPPPQEDFPSEEQEEIPEDIQKQLNKNNKIGVPSTPVKDPETGEWRVEELQ